ncbi:MAG: hypothetical protein ABIE36_02545 [Candidatus Diapherotrites archaeon]
MGKEGIIEKYDFRNNIINSLKYVGTIGGGVYVLLSAGPNGIGEMLVGRVF